METSKDSQIDNFVDFIRIAFLAQAENKEQAKEINRRFDEIAHNAKALNAFMNEHNIPKGVLHKILADLNKRLQ